MLRSISKYVITLSIVISSCGISTQNNIDDEENGLKSCNIDNIPILKTEEIPLLTTEEIPQNVFKEDDEEQEDCLVEENVIYNFTGIPKVSKCGENDCFVLLSDTDSDLSDIEQENTIQTGEIIEIPKDVFFYEYELLLNETFKRNCFKGAYMSPSVLNFIKINSTKDYFKTKFTVIGNDIVRNESIQNGIIFAQDTFAKDAFIFNTFKQFRFFCSFIARIIIGNGGVIVLASGVNKVKIGSGHKINKITIGNFTTRNADETIDCIILLGLLGSSLTNVFDININEMFKNGKIFDQEMSGFVNSQNFEIKKYAFVAVCSYLTDKDCKLETHSNGKTFLIFEDTEQKNKIFLGKQDVENTIFKTLYF